MRRTVLMLAVLAVATTALAWVTGQASGQLGHHVGTAHEVTQPAADVSPVAQHAPRQRVAERSRALHKKPELVPGKRLLGRGDHGTDVRVLQARLRQIAWLSGDVDDDYDSGVVSAVRGFQAKRGIAVTGYVDARTMQRLRAMTHTPTTAELENKLTPMGNVPGKLDARCLTGRAMCIDKTSRTLRFLVDGKVLRTVDVRFGASYSPTREGVFHVYWKDENHISKMYGSAMPDSMFFSRGQAVHYSSDFAARGYTGASHGCVNVRDLAGIQWLFAHVRVGDKVVIYWS